FVTARDLPMLYGSPAVRAKDRAAIARHMAERQTFLTTDDGAFSAADMLQVLLGMDPGAVEGPVARGESTYRAGTIRRPAFERAKADVAGTIRANRRLPADVWVGAEKLSLADFAATLAADDGASAAVAIRKGNPEME